jgi:hypothetical protein
VRSSNQGSERHGYLISLVLQFGRVIHSSVVLA